MGHSCQLCMLHTIQRLVDRVYCLFCLWAACRHSFCATDSACSCGVAQGYSQWVKQRVIHEISFANQLRFFSLLNCQEQEVVFHCEIWHDFLVSCRVSFRLLADEINNKAGAVAKSSSSSPSAAAPIPPKAGKCLDSLVSFWNSVDRVFPFVVFKVGVKFDASKCFPLLI